MWLKKISDLSCLKEIHPKHNLEYLSKFQLSLFCLFMLGASPDFTRWCIIVLILSSAYYPFIFKSQLLWVDQVPLCKDTSKAWLNFELHCYYLDFWKIFHASCSLMHLYNNSNSQKICCNWVISCSFVNDKAWNLIRKQISNTLKKIDVFF